MNTINQISRMNAADFCLLTKIKLKPSLIETWDDRYAKIFLDPSREDAPIAAAYRNIRWVWTPVNSLSALENQVESSRHPHEAVVSEETQLLRMDLDLSYSGTDPQIGNYIQADMFEFAAGQEDRVREVFANYRNLAKQYDIPGNYSVSWGLIGSPRNIVMAVCSGPSPLAMAQREARIKQVLAEQGMDRLVDAFSEIAIGSNQFSGTMLN
jgi:hypothetical protein